MIPAEAVEAAAIVLWDKEMNAPWSSVADGFKAPFLRDARAALEAAAPYMQQSPKTEVSWDAVNAQLNSLLRAPVDPDEPTEDMGQ